MKKSDITKRNILTAAEEAFAEKGYYGARVDEIAGKAAVNKRMIYAHYGNKENLYIAVLDEVYRRMAEEEAAFINSHMDCAEAVNEIIAHYFRFLSSNPSFVKIVMWENLNEAVYFQKSQARFMKTTAMALLGEKIRQGVEKGIFKENIDIPETVMTINMMCFSYFSNIYTMAQLMQIDFHGEEAQSRRCAHVQEVIMEYLTKANGGESACSN